MALYCSIQMLVLSLEFRDFFYVYVLDAIED